MQEQPNSIREALTALNLARNCASLKIEVQLADSFAALIDIAPGSIGITKVEIYVLFSQCNFLCQLGIVSPLTNACSVL